MHGPEQLRTAARLDSLRTLIPLGSLHLPARPRLADTGPMQRRPIRQKGVGALAGLVLFIGVYKLDDLIGGSGTASRVVALIVLFVVAVGVGSVGLIRSERQRNKRRGRRPR